MIKYPSLILAILVIIIPYSCIDPITINAESDDRLLVIDGFFSTAATAHNITLSYTRDVGSGISDPALNAIVKIIDGQGNSAIYEEEQNGIYTIDDAAFRGKEGESYYLEITLANNQQYQTAPQVIPPKVIPQNLRFSIEKDQSVNEFNILVEKTFIKLLIDTPVKKDGENLFLRWRTDEVYSFADEACGGLDMPRTCYVTLMPKQDIATLSGRNLSEGVIENIPIFSKLLQPKMPEFEGKHAFNVYQQSITKSAFDYLENINKVALQTGSIFDAPPAAIPGNLFNVADPDELVLGFFEVSSIDTIRTFVRPIDFQGKYSFLQYCKNTFPDRFTRDCCECLTIEGSSTVQPDYW